MHKLLLLFLGSRVLASTYFSFLTRKTSTPTVLEEEPVPSIRCPYTDDEVSSSSAVKRSTAGHEIGALVRRIDEACKQAEEIIERNRKRKEMAQEEARKASANVGEEDNAIGEQVVVIASGED